MDDPIVLQWGNHDVTCTVFEGEDGVAIDLAIPARQESWVLTMDLVTAWRLCDALARATTRAALSRAEATKGVTT